MTDCKYAELERKNKLLTAALNECLDGIEYTLRVDAVLRPEERHVGLEKLIRHRSLIPNHKDKS